MLMVKKHGGSVCGITHIHYFQCNPEYVLGPKKSGPDESEPSIESSSMTGVGGGYTAPRQTARERFGLLVSLVKDARPSGCIEVVMTDFGLSVYPGWDKVFAEAGFQKIARVKNSNSGQPMNIYHLYYGQPPGYGQVVPPPVEKPKPVRKPKAVKAEAAPAAE